MCREDASARLQAMGAMTTRSRLLVAIGSSLLLSGLGLALLGVGAAIESWLLPPPSWNLEDHSRTAPRRLVEIDNAICRFDARWSEAQGALCVIPVVRRGYAKPTDGHDYASVSLLYLAPCQPKTPTVASPCRPRGYLSSWKEAKSVTATMRKQFTGFRGMVLDAPSEARTQARRKGSATMGGFALMLILVGGTLFRRGTREARG